MPVLPRTHLPPPQWRQQRGWRLQASVSLQEGQHWPPRPRRRRAAGSPVPTCPSQWAGAPWALTADPAPPVVGAGPHLAPPQQQQPGLLLPERRRARQRRRRQRRRPARRPCRWQWWWRVAAPGGWVWTGAWWRSGLRPASEPRWRLQWHGPGGLLGGREGRGIERGKAERVPLDHVGPTNACNSLHSLPMQHALSHEMGLTPNNPLIRALTRLLWRLLCSGP